MENISSSSRSEASKLSRMYCVCVALVGPGPNTPRTVVSEEQCGEFLIDLLDSSHSHSLDYEESHLLTAEILKLYPEKNAIP